MASILGPNIEKSVKDLQRCTVSLTRYRVMIKEEVDSSVKKIKAAFAELHNWWVKADPQPQIPSVRAIPMASKKHQMEKVVYLMHKHHRTALWLTLFKVLQAEK